MRVLLAISPSLGHLFPPISIAHALRAAGHEVLFAATGAGVQVHVAHAGLQVFDSAPGVDTDAVFGDFLAGRGLTFDWLRTDRPEAPPVAAELFAKISDLTVDRTVEVALDWRPDLVIHTELQAAGPLVAAKLGVPSVEHVISINHFRQISTLFRPWMAAAYERHGVTSAPRIAATLDTRPPSMVEFDLGGWYFQCVPYNGGGVLPPWLLKPPVRPRVAVTVGTLVPKLGGLGALRGLVEAVGALDAEFVLALLADADLSGLGELPDNVRVEDWVPLTPLLATCTAMIHHGGVGTSLAGLSAGVSHLVLPGGADQFEAGELIRKRGLGLVSSAEAVTTELVRTVLFDETMKAAAAEVRAEIEELPTPADLVPRLEKLAC